ncbi:uncharacterized protein LOC134541223 [Bacillus rossius redtenbacheri]|uniref:uncharacterized protein LOC134541223 n=1 Tax=Bacillus rossius redtenbacheri TaxID=93214 RepID=UPI002FDE0022
MTCVMASTANMIVVSNRLPFILVRNPETGKLQRKASAGGLVTAVAPVVIQSKGLWVGWPGIHLEDESVAIPESEPGDTTPTAGLKSEKVVIVHVDEELFDSYYNGCCNGMFWPLFHSMPDRAVFQGEKWKAYEKVNSLFADQTVEALRRLQLDCSSIDKSNTPLIWVHDYHLTLAANGIRQSTKDCNLECKIGFFLHIPFPPWDIFRLCPWGDVILQGLLGCDMVGFHIEDYCMNFVECCQRRLGCRVDRKNYLVEHGGRTVRARALPIGIPFERFVHLARTTPKVVFTNQNIILGVDRLDYTKGLVHRLGAFELLLERYPEHLEKVTFLQIAVPSRTDVKEYQELKEEMDQIVGRINGRFSTANWSPIRYIYACVGQDELAAFYRDASVALVTPLRDGMNLVAKEFVACQINEPPGVLVVSPFAGAYETMLEALVCNPYELEEASEVIHRALTMPEDERTLRMNGLRRREKLNDVNQWVRMFLKAMGCVVEGMSDDSLPITMHPVTPDDFDYLEKYVGLNNKLALLLDYDGTLAPLAPRPELAILPPETKNVLQRLSNMSDVYIAVVSGRSVDDVKSMVGIDSITYAGNHGLEILHPDGSTFVHPMPVEYEKKVKAVMKELQEKVCREGAWVENKGAILTFHYHETPPKLRQTVVAEAEGIIRAAGFLVGKARYALEVKPPIEWDKGRASHYILRTVFGVDWIERIRIIYVGDDETDEDAMEALKGMAVTFRITTSHITHTVAQHRLPSTDAVLALLKWVERHLAQRRVKLSDESLLHTSHSRHSIAVEVLYSGPEKNGGSSQ